MNGKNNTYNSLIDFWFELFFFKNEVSMVFCAQQAITVISGQLRMKMI